MRVIYLSGPYSGDEEANAKRFLEAAQFLWDRGYAVINPIGGSHGCTGPRERFIQGDLEIIGRLNRISDALYLLKGWQQSEGAKEERQKAYTHGLVIYRQGESEPPDMTGGTDGHKY